jgi:CDP-diacylglycerol---serine O-phosphatidyltransferase
MNDIKPIDRRATGPFQRRIKRLKTLPVLPTLLTAGNLASGITAILCAAHHGEGDQYLLMGAIMVFVAMFFDMLDGKVARMTKTAGAFGAELDSLSDVVSFGVAPAILVHRLILGQPGVFAAGERLLWFCTVFYPVMAAIRLARYNVEHSDEATPYFRGLPSPGAAALVCSWIIFFYNPKFVEVPDTPFKYTGLFAMDWYRWTVLALSLVAALAMVSTVRYPHVGNTLLGRMSFRKVILLLVLISLFVAAPSAMLLVATTGYLLWGLVGELFTMWRKWRQGGNPLDDPEDTEADDAGVETEKPATSGPMSGR